MRKNIYLLIFFLIGYSSIAFGEVKVTKLQCDGRENPLGILPSKLEFSWQLESKEKNQKQTAYRIIIDEVWDSGKIKSDNTFGIRYDGPELESRQRYNWKVMVWDKDDKPSKWSNNAVFTLGIIKPDSWKGKWIASRNVPMNPPVGQNFIPAPNTPGKFHDGEKPDSREEAILLRKNLTLEANPKRVFIRLTALGMAELYVNGQRVNNRIMCPGLTDFTKRIYYDTYDVTPFLKKGVNTIGILLGNGYFSSPNRGWAQWYGVGNEPSCTAEIEAELTNGASFRLGTDESWKWSTAEITSNDFFTGEKQDLRLAQNGWSEPKFNSEAWNSVVIIDPTPANLEPNPSPWIRVFEDIEPIRRDSNRYIFESMYTGFPRVEVEGNAGDTVRIKGEEDHATYEFILKGEGVEILEPHFTVHSIGPILTIEGLYPSNIKTVSIRYVHADLPQTGDFISSSQFLNKIYSALKRTHLNYTWDFPADPTREKAGWVQDVQTMLHSASYFTKMDNVYRRWWWDMYDSQTPDGASASVTPMVWGGLERIHDDPWWSGMIIYTPWNLYQFYGDRTIIEDAYVSMAAYFKWISSQADEDGIMRWSGASDWMEVGLDDWGTPKRTPTFLVSTCAWYLYADILRRSAELLNKDEDAIAYAAKAEKIKNVFNEKYFDPQTGFYANATNSQTAFVLPLSVNMVPEEKRELVIQRLKENINSWDNHLNTGFVGTPYLLQGLPEWGLTDLSYEIVNQKDYAGWNTLISDGVMKEAWNGGMAQMPSLGGSVGLWLFGTPGGILPDPDGPGFKKFIIRPYTGHDLTWCNTYHDSPQGRIICNWSKENDKFSMTVKVPVNSTATVFVPANKIKVKGAKLIREEKDLTVFEVGSGSYYFNEEE